MKPNPYASKAQAEIAAIYVQKIGYDPFEDDSTLTTTQVAEILAEYDEEVAACAARAKSESAS